MRPVMLGVGSLDGARFGRWPHLAASRKEIRASVLSRMSCCGVCSHPTTGLSLQAMAGAGPLALPELARRVDADVQRVHSDVRAALKDCTLDRNRHSGGQNKIV